MSKRLRLFGNVTVALAVGLLAAACLSSQKALKAQSSARSGTAGLVTLQYRISRDAFAPSKFVVIVGGGMSSGVTLVWRLPSPESDEEKIAQQEDKERFHHLIELLEAKQINGVEFECSGNLRGLVLQATDVPHLTDRGRRQIETQRQ
jgi:hypothetical protein